MTTIAWDGCTLAADKQATNCGLRRTVKKIARITKGPYEGYLAGFSGLIYLWLELQAWLESGADPKSFPEKQTGTDTSTHVLLISPKGKVYVLEEGPYPSPFEDIIFACGSGRDFALGAMAAGTSAREAVEIASRFDCSSGMGVDVLHLVEPK
jgi:ATP-dependent protease HslVU (ClpYQ) peptidase subunit